MARGSNVGKVEVWRRRLAKFEASGLTVSAFCRRENVAAPRFYYWARRVREAGAMHNKPTVKSVSATQACSAPVEVFIGDQVRVCLPADNRELVTSVLQSLQPTGAFQRIDVGNVLATRQ